VKNVLIRVALAVFFSSVGVGATYLGSSFIAWNWDPGHWDGFGRFWALFLGMSTGVAGFLVPFDEVKK